MIAYKNKSGEILAENSNRSYLLSQDGWERIPPGVRIYYITQLVRACCGGPCRKLVVFYTTDKDIANKALKAEGPNNGRLSYWVESEYTE